MARGPFPRLPLHQDDSNSGPPVHACKDRAQRVAAVQAGRQRVMEKAMAAWDKLVVLDWVAAGRTVFES